MVKTIEVYVIGGSPSDMVESLLRPSGDEAELLGLDARPRRPKKLARRRPSPTDVVLAVRRDLLEARKRLLDGRPDDALADVDTAIDGIDNWLAER